MLRSFGLERLTFIVAPCDKACYDAYRSDSINRFRFTDVRVRRIIIKLLLQIVNFIANHAELIHKYKN